MAGSSGTDLRNRSSSEYPSCSGIAMSVRSTSRLSFAIARSASSAVAANRPAKGFAFGVGLLVVGFEFEFAQTSENVEDAAPSLRTGMGNVLVQTPIPVAGMQFYLTTGGGVFRETLRERQETHLGVNTGGGVKVSLLGPGPPQTVSARSKYTGGGSQISRRKKAPLLNTREQRPKAASASLLEWLPPEV